MKKVKDKVKPKEGMVDAAIWEHEDPEKKIDLHREIRGIARILRSLNRDELAVGKIYFCLFSLLLVALAAGYVYSHYKSPKTHIANETAVQVVAGVLNKMDTYISRLRAQAPVQGATNDLPTLRGDLQKNLQELPRSSLSFQTWRLLGNMQAEIDTNQIGTTSTFNDFRKKLELELENLYSGYFWDDIPRRWIEIACWAEFGTLVGLLFYVAGQLQSGSFQVADASMFWTEILIAPFVILTIFFLFTYTGIVSIDLAQLSMTVYLGFAFILGFAIRRTIGLLDTIKKRLFPEPEPTGEAPS